MGTELLVGLLVVSSLSIQPSQPLIPVAYAAEPLVEIPQEVILEAPPQVPPILEKVAFCESGGRQFNRQGRVIRGKIDSRDIGKYQINIYWNGAEAERLGYDLFTEEGNTGMALHLYKTRGLDPWKASKSCWAGAS